MFLRSRGCSQLLTGQAVKRVTVKPKPTKTGITEELLFFLFVWCFVVLFCFYFSCPCFGKIPSAELHPLAYILSTTISSVSPKTSWHGRSHVVGQSGWHQVWDPASWAAAHTQFALEQLCQPKKKKKKTSWAWVCSYLSPFFLSS